MGVFVGVIWIVYGIFGVGIFGRKRFFERYFGRRVYINC